VIVFSGVVVLRGDREFDGDSCRTGLDGPAEPTQTSTAPAAGGQGWATTIPNGVVSWVPAQKSNQVEAPVSGWRAQARRGGGGAGSRTPIAG
jgi:hypothetical protein